MASLVEPLTQRGQHWLAARLARLESLGVGVVERLAFDAVQPAIELDRLVGPAALALGLPTQEYVAMRMKAYDGRLPEMQWHRT